MRHNGIRINCLEAVGARKAAMASSPMIQVLGLVYEGWILETGRPEHQSALNTICGGGMVIVKSAGGWTLKDLHSSEGKFIVVVYFLRAGISRLGARTKHKLGLRRDAIVNDDRWPVLNAKLDTYFTQHQLFQNSI